MKKLLIFAMAFGLAACQTDKTDVNGGLAGDSQTSFLSVNIVSQGTSRADDDGYETNGGKYEDGTSTENDVKKVRFYFFTEDGDAAVVRDGKSYYDWTPDSNNGATDHPNSVEKILSAVVVINTEDGHKTPHSIVAIINPTNDILTKGDLTSPSLTDLNDYVKDFGVSATSETGFVMSNSIYVDNTNVVEDVPVEGHLYPTEPAAIGDPVIIRVERVVAKVGLTTSLEKTDNKEIYSTQVSTDDEDATPVYVKILGWNVTTVTTTSNLMKDINPVWNSNLFGSEPWNWPDHRSFWAVNPKSVEVAYGPFGPAPTTEDEEGEPKQEEEEEDAIPSNAARAIKLGEYTYTQENAAKDHGTGTTTDTPTQIIIAAQLVNKDGSTLELAKYGGKVYSGRDAVKNLLATAANVYTAETIGDSTGSETKYNSITPEALDFITATAYEKKQPDSGIETPEDMATQDKARYYVYAALAKTAESTIYYYADGVEDGKVKYTAYESVDKINDYLKTLGRVMLWAEGMTYYYFNINHFGTEGNPGYYGVVRNHVYKNNITVLKGLGTPVYDPTEDIIPEKPEDDEIVIAAQVEILSWRVVNNDDVQLVW